MTDLDPVYVAARRILLDALAALKPHLGAVVVVGAHAVYLRTGDAGIAIAPFTTDADLALQPEILADRPELERLLLDAGFEREENKPGSWIAKTTIEGSEVPVPVDLMVPDAAAPAGSRRAVDLPGHDRMATRRAIGLEGCLVDNSVEVIQALDFDDDRSISVRVAGPTALIIAKLHKLQDRKDDDRRLADKDAGDVFRLMQSTDAAEFLSMTRRLLDDPLSSHSTRSALGYLDGLFGARARPGVVMAVRAMDPAVPADLVEGVCAAFLKKVREARL